MRLAPFAASGLVLGLAACAHTRPNSNAAVAQVQAPPTIPLASKPTVSQEVHAVVNDKVDVSFPNGSAQLTGTANQQLDVAARLFRDANPVEMYVSGHSDSIGDEYNNLLLSARRAEAVKRGLAARGIPADRLLIEAYGEARPIDSADPASANNRSTVITWRLL